MAKELDNIEKLFTDLAKKQVPVQNVWAECVSVDWNKKTMQAKSLVDGLDYFDVLLGIGSEYKKPAEGSKCLMGVIANKAAASYLIYAEVVEEHLIEDSTGFKVYLKEGLLTLNGDNFGGMIKVEDLVNDINEIKQALNDHITEYNTHTHNSPQAPTGTLVTAPPLIGSTVTALQDTAAADIVNDTILHGDG